MSSFYRTVLRTGGLELESGKDGYWDIQGALEQDIKSFKSNVPHSLLSLLLENIFLFMYTGCVKQ